jgi:predicted transcriptional regulator
MMEAHTESMETPSDINETDAAILRLLAAGRETRGSLAAELGKHENYVSERLKWLRAYELVAYRHQETALYEITVQGAEWVEEHATEEGDQ